MNQPLFLPGNKHPFSASPTRATAPRDAFRLSAAEGAWFGIALLIGTACSFVLAGAGCTQKSGPSPALDPERFDRAYVAFVDKEVMPLAKRDGLTHTAGGCDASGTDLLCVECFSHGGESWVRCNDDGCSHATTADELAAVGADVGVCERRESRDGLAVSFTRSGR